MDKENKRANHSWKKLTKSLGKVNNNSKSEVIFHSSNPLPEIKLLRSSCGCSNAKANRQLGTLKVTIKHKIAKHLAIQDFTRTVWVHYKEGTYDELKITGKIIKQL